MYVTIGGEGHSEIIEKKSRFLGTAIHVSDGDEAAEFVKSVKAKYPDARHNVYAYMTGTSNTRYSDDGEPGGTAGMPVLDTIRKSGITDAAIVVTRYFGGILLGTGGLVRAYSAAAKAALEDAGIVSLEMHTRFTLALSYSDFQKCDPELTRSGVKRRDTAYSDGVTLDLLIREDAFQALRDKLCEITAGRAIIEITGSELA